jgi:hypothetical protein
MCMVWYVPRNPTSDTRSTGAFGSPMPMGMSPALLSTEPWHRRSGSPLPQWHRLFDSFSDIVRPCNSHPNRFLRLGGKPGEPGENRGQPRCEVPSCTPIRAQISTTCYSIGVLNTVICSPIGAHSLPLCTPIGSHSWERGGKHAP